MIILMKYVLCRQFSDTSNKPVRPSKMKRIGGSTNAIRSYVLESENHDKFKQKMDVMKKQQQKRQQRQLIVQAQNQEQKTITVTDGKNGTDTSRLASVLVVAGFIPVCCCLFFMCLNCPVFVLYTKLSEMLLQQKQTRLALKIEEERVENWLTVLRETKNKQEKDLVKTTRLVTNSNVRETTCVV